MPISVSTAVLKDAQGRVVGGAETFRDLSDLGALRRDLEGRWQSGDLVSRSPLMQKVFEMLPAISTSSSTVLICGETGTGKELMARTIHSLSHQCKGPFVAVSCGALPDTLLESELFGYKAGAFTGAVKNKPGRFALARGGTLFLDEIGEISPALQVRLLRVLQERTYDPLGAVRSETTDARIIAATHKDLAEELTGHGNTKICTSCSMQSAKDILDAQAIRSAVARNDNNRVAAARELGIHRSTLFRKIKKLGIVLPEKDGRSRRIEKA